MSWSHSNMWLLPIVLVLCASPNVHGFRSFEVHNNSFVVDGAPVQLVSCSIHYFRVPRDYWLDRLQRVKALGCNAIQFYIPWNFHEPVRGVYDFDGQRDVEAFIKLAAQLEMLVLLRPGPYSCGEWDLGGFPAWMLDPNVVGPDLMGHFRTADKTYLKHVDSWWDALLPRIAPLVIAKGGPIAMVQLENEYGFWNPSGDKAYLQHLKDSASRHLGADMVYYTTDSPLVTARGGLDGNATVNIVDFGPGTDVDAAFAAQAAANAPGQSPPMCSEYYTGWLTHWGERMANSTAAAVATTLAQILSFRNNTGSVNLYMAHGGTSFGFWAGANGNLPDITSYDYDGPVSEAGARGQPGTGGDSKFEAIREVIANATKRKALPLPRQPEAQDLGAVRMTEHHHLLDRLNVLSAFAEPIESEEALPMEHYGCGTGMVIYEKAVPCALLAGGSIQLRANDYAQVFVGANLVATSWRRVPLSLPIPRDACRADAGVTARLTVLVQAMGRENFFSLGTAELLSKGITGPVVVNPGDAGPPQQLKHWRVTLLPLNVPGALLPWEGARASTAQRDHGRRRSAMSFDSLTGGCWKGFNDGPPRRKALAQTAADAHAAGRSGLAGEVDASRGSRGRSIGAGVRRESDEDSVAAPASNSILLHGRLRHGPVILRGTFQVPNTTDGVLLDTFLRTDGWHKGVAWVNQHNLGHYWSVKGPQATLYVPRQFLEAGTNELVLLEMDYVPDKKSVSFVAEPDFQGPSTPQMIL